MTARDDKLATPLALDRLAPDELKALAGALELELDTFTADEVELLAGIVQAIRNQQHVVPLPGQRLTLHRIELKLQARNRKARA